jgi:hypothetical protein
MSKYNTNYKPRSQTIKIQNEIINIFLEQNPRLTVRQIYYALTVKGVVSKVKSGYRQTCYHLKVMREKGLIPYGWIADNTRWQIKPETDTSLESALSRFQQAYRRDLWANQSDYVEIWVEKDALAGVISPITEEFDVPLYVSRGYGSMTFIYEASEQIKSIGKPTYIYHFGDFDPSGVDAAHKIEMGLLQHGANIQFKRAAITLEQILLLDLPARETKRSDPRSNSWGDLPSVELDALPAPILRNIVKRCIQHHIDSDVLEATRLVESLERSTLENIRQNLVPVQKSSDGGKID